MTEPNAPQITRLNTTAGDFFARLDALLAFESAVNVTLGLPIVRTSPDHGTAFDIAGQGVADPGSMVEAILLAAELARHMEPSR